MHNNQPRLWRSRWAAIGAAVAVTLGAGGLATTFADSAPSSLVAISPVRVLDTRLSGFGGALAVNTPRLLQITGTVPTVAADGVTVSNLAPVPPGATAIVANVTAVTPSSTGFVSVRPGSATGIPTTSNLNFTLGDEVVPNSVTVEIPTTGTGAGQVELYFAGAAGATTDLLVDIVGYYQAAPTTAGVSVWETIPTGITVTGNAVWDSQSAGGTPGADTDSLYVPFGAQAPVALTSTQVNIATAGFGDSDATCTGTVLAPTAPAGKVCIYVSAWGAVVESTLAGNRTALNKAGFQIDWESDGILGEDAFVYATWAYTAP